MVFHPQRVLITQLVNIVDDFNHALLPQEIKCVIGLALLAEFDNNSTAVQAAVSIGVSIGILQ